MAKIHPNGMLSGKVGNVIFSNWRGIPYQRSRPVFKDQSSTFPQRWQRARFTVGFQFLKPMASLVKITFKTEARRMTAFNKALSLVLKQAVSGISFPDFTIDYRQVLVSKGNLTNGAFSATVQPSGGRLLFTWRNGAGFGNAREDDRAILVAYCEEAQNCTFTTVGAFRKEEKDYLKVPLFGGKKVQTWIAFISEDGKTVSNSIYTGEVNME